MQYSYLDAKRIYHYTNAEGLLGILGGEWWATEARYLNDPTELLLGMTGFEDFVTHSPLSSVDRKRIVNTMQEEYSKLYGTGGYDEKFVISFSFQKDSPLMWSEFPGFSGYCLGFDKHEITSSFQNEEYELVALGHVNYIDDGSWGFDTASLFFWAKKRDSKIEDAESALRLLAGCSHDTLRQECKEIAKSFFSSGALCKNSCFSREFEYRMVFAHKPRCDDECNTANPTVSFRVRNNSFIPFAKIKCSIINSLREICVGPTGDFAFVQRGLQRLLDSKGISVPIEQSTVPLRY